MQIDWLYRWSHNNNVVTHPASPCWWWRLAPEVMRAERQPEPEPEETLTPCSARPPPSHCCLPCQPGVNKTWASLLNTNRVTLFNLQPQYEHWTSAVSSSDVGVVSSDIRLEHLVCCPHAAPYLMIASIYLMAQIYLFDHSRTYASRKCMSCFK